LIIALLISTTGTTQVLTSDAVLSSKVDEAVRREAILNGVAEFLVITKDLEDVVNGLRHNIIRVFRDFNTLLAYGDLATLARLDRDPSVVRVVPNFIVRTQFTEVSKVISLSTSEGVREIYSWGRARVGAGVVGDEFNLSGDGVIVAILDTGISLQHEELTGKLITVDPLDRRYPGGWIEFDRRGNPICSEPRDTYFHGTWVSSIVAGRYIGIAPRAKLMHALVLHGGEGTAAQVLAGLEWVLNPYTCSGQRVPIKPDVVSLSLGALGNYSDVFLEPISKLIKSNITVVAAIGNGGPGTSANPGNIWGVIGVGALNRDDSVADFSSSEVVEWPSPPKEWPFKNTYPSKYVKPDFTAPGVYIPGAYVINGYYVIASGTSAAAPITAGVVALVTEVYKKLLNRSPTVDEVYDILNKTSQRVCEGSRCGWGVVNAVKAVSEALNNTLGDVKVLVNATSVKTPGYLRVVAPASMTYYFDHYMLGSGTAVTLHIPPSDMGYHYIHGIGDGYYSYEKIYVEPNVVVSNEAVVAGDLITLNITGFPSGSSILIYLNDNLLTYKPLGLRGSGSVSIVIPYTRVGGTYELLLMDDSGLISESFEINVTSGEPHNFNLVASAPPTSYVNSTVDVYVISLVDGKLMDASEIRCVIIGDNPLTLTNLTKVGLGIYRMSYRALSPGTYVVLVNGSVTVYGRVLNSVAVALTDVKEEAPEGISKYPTLISLANKTAVLESNVTYLENKLLSIEEFLRGLNESVEVFSKYLGNLSDMHTAMLNEFSALSTEVGSIKHIVTVLFIIMAALIIITLALVIKR